MPIAVGLSFLVGFFRNVQAAGSAASPDMGRPLQGAVRGVTPGLR